MTTTEKLSLRKDGSHIVACPEEKYEDLLMVKVDNLRSLLNWKSEDIEVFRSPISHFRMRANFNLWHDNPSNRSPNGSFFAMFDEENKKIPCEIVDFPRGTLLINKLMRELKDAFVESTALFNNCFEVRFVTTCINDIIFKVQIHNQYTK